VSDDPGIRLCCLLWAVDGEEAGMHAYEDAVLRLVAEHRGEVISRELGDGGDGTPHEVQVFGFADQAGLDGYLGDGRRAALARERERVVARTQLFAVRLPDADGSRP
jgi:hypothetical protein